MRKFAILLTNLLAAPLIAQQHPTMTAIPQISVGSRGEVKVTPDRATIHISVQTRAATAAAAAAENATKQKAVIDALRTLGLAPADISTSGYNVYPEQRYEANREPVVIGYNVTNTLLVELKSVDMVGRVIDAALSRGANMITSLQFFASNTEAARRQAIASAIQKARLDAEAAARAAGGALGGLLEINVGTYFPPPPRPMEMSLRAAAAQAPETPISPGDQVVVVDVGTRWSFVPGNR